MQNNRIRPLIAVTFAILMSLSALLVYVPEEAESQTGLPNFSIQPVAPYTEAEIDVRPGGQPFDKVVLQIVNTGTGAITVELNIPSQGFAVSYVASNTVGQGSSIDVIVQVATTPYTPMVITSLSFTGQITEWEGQPYSGGTPKNGQFLVTVTQFARAQLSSPRPFEKVRPGKEHQYKVTLKNEGNGKDDFRIEIMNKAKLEDEGFSVTLELTQIQLKSTEERVVSINVQTPRDYWSDDYYNIDIRATSLLEQSGKGEYVDYSITTWVRGVYFPGFEPFFSIVLLAFVAVAMASKRDSNVKMSRKLNDDLLE